jgi:uncharacterized protein with HEPN domain
MPRDTRQVLLDIHLAAERVLRYTRGYSYEQFGEDEKTLDGVVHNLELISAAAEELPAEQRERSAQAGWTRLAELRDLAMEQPFDLDTGLVWELAQELVPGLLEQVRELLAAAGGPQPLVAGAVGALTKVESTMLYAIGYDPGTQVLETVFYSGGIYRYFGVPQDLYEGLQAAFSKGRYMWANVLQQYPYERVRRRR